MSSIKTGLLSAALSLSCVMAASAAPPVKEVLQSSFKPKGQATLERLDQDKTQQACSTGEALSGEAAAKVIADNSASVRYPAGGKYLGDWMSGDKIAQTGTGLQSSDDPAKPAGGNCYACHQLAEAEIAV